MIHCYTECVWSLKSSEVVRGTISHTLSSHIGRVLKGVIYYCLMSGKKKCLGSKQSVQVHCSRYEVITCKPEFQDSSKYLV